MKCWTQPFGGSVALTAALAIFFAMPRLALAQPIGMLKGRNITLPEFYDPPFQNQMKSQLKAAKAEPQGENRLLLWEVTLETFSTNGVREMVCKTPQCTLDLTKRTASSPDAIQGQSEDGQLKVAGEGFLWQQTTSTLILSNRVHTTIRQPPRKLEPLRP